MNTPAQRDVAHAVRDGVTRAVTAVGLAGIGLIHLLDAPSKFHETPYMGWMYVGLIAAVLATAFALVRRPAPVVWLAAAALALAAIVGYTLTRTVGLPQAHGDIGNWGEPLGMASLFVEGGVVALSVSALAQKLPRPAARTAAPRARAAELARG